MFRRGAIRAVMAPITGNDVHGQLSPSKSLWWSPPAHQPGNHLPRVPARSNLAQIASVVLEDAGSDLHSHARINSGNPVAIKVAPDRAAHETHVLHHRVFAASSFHSFPSWR